MNIEFKVMVRWQVQEGLQWADLIGFQVVGVTLPATLDLVLDQLLQGPDVVAVRWQAEGAEKVHIVRKGG